MDNFCTFVLDRAAVHPPFRFNEKSDTLDVCEINPCHPSHEFENPQVPDTDIDSWLNKDPPTQTGALRLVWIPLHKDVRPWQLDIRKSSLDVILSTFTLDEAFKYGFTNPANFEVIPVSQAAPPDTRVFSMCFTSLFALTWKHDSRSGRTDAVCWVDGWVAETMQELMSKQRRWARHPLFLALVASVALVYVVDRDMVCEVKTIAAVENRTKYRGFTNSHVGVARGDYASLSERMSGCAVSVGGLERLYRILREFLDDLSDYSKRYRVRDELGLEVVNTEVEVCVESLKRRLKMQKIQIDHLSRRVQMQQTAVSHASIIPHFPDLNAEQ